MILISNLTISPIREEFLKRVAKKVLKGENKGEADLSIVLVGPQRMRKLNKRYRGKNRVTDVLAFGQTEKFPSPPDLKAGLGEIVVCLREVKKNAKRFNSTPETELTLCLIHGILHLLGYGHEDSEKKAKEMEEKQKYYLKLCPDPTS